jgi:hypothetical protein
MLTGEGGGGGGGGAGRIRIRAKTFQGNATMVTPTPRVDQL